MSKYFSVLSITAFFCSLLLLGGCTTKLPLTVALTPEETIEAEEQLQRFLKQTCVQAIDSDVRLGWHALGEHTAYSATLQLAAPSSLRLALTDPLGRPLYLLAVYDSNFTFVDNLHGKGYTGATDSDFVYQYLPRGMNPKEIFNWLSARIRNNGLKLISVRKGEKNQLFWYEVTYNNSERHLLGIGAKKLYKHLVVDANDDILLNVTYSRFTDTPADCNWPGSVDITGEGFSPDYSVEFVKKYSFSMPDTQIFRLQLPAHFIQHTIE